MNMKTYSIVISSVAFIGVVCTATLSGVFVTHQNRYSILDSDFQELQDSFSLLADSFSSLQTNYTSLEDNYTLICGENDDLATLYQDLNDSYEDLLADFTALNASYIQLNNTHNSLSSDYSDLLVLYTQLQSTYSQLVADYAALNSLYVSALASLNGIISSLKALPYLEKLKVYSHFCREMCGDQSNLYIICKDIILHASKQYNNFTKVDNLLGSNFWDGQSSMDYAWDKLVDLYGAKVFLWSGTSAPDVIFNWIKVISDFEYISDDITGLGRGYSCDYCLFPIETLFYSGGDCEDFAIFCGTLLENNGHEVAFAELHDDSYYPGGLDHAFLWLKIDYDYWYTHNINNPLFSFDGGVTYEWICVDPTPYWQINIWTIPDWLKYYFDNGIAIADWASKGRVVLVEP